jgi:STE24 endopeptidase
MAVGLFALPIANGWSRHVEWQADDFALRLTGNAPAFIAAMERLGALNLAEAEPHPIKELLFYSHPSIRRRVRSASAFLHQST